MVERSAGPNQGPFVNLEWMERTMRIPDCRIAFLIVGGGGCWQGKIAAFDLIV
jgi:hypothetical protein